MFFGGVPERERMWPAQKPSRRDRASVLGARSRSSSTAKLGGPQEAAGGPLSYLSFPFLSRRRRFGAGSERLVRPRIKVSFHSPLLVCLKRRRHFGLPLRGVRVRVRVREWAAERIRSGRKWPGKDTCARPRSSVGCGPRRLFFHSNQRICIGWAASPFRGRNGSALS